MDREQKVRLARIITAALLTGAAMLSSARGVWQGLLFVIPFLIIGSDILYRAIRNIRRGEVFDENFLMSIATVAAFWMGEYAESVAVMLFFQIGELCQNIAVGKSRKSIAALTKIRPDHANVKRDGSLVEVPPESVEVGDMIIIKPGERIPLDGVITAGETTVDTSALTGESLLVSGNEGDAVISGCINLSGLITVRVTSVAADSTVARILSMTETQSEKKARTEKFITRFARIYTPAVCACALLLAVLPPLLQGDGWTEWLRRAIIFLVVSCPCALVLSVPLAYFAGIGGASRKGVLVKGASALEALAKAKIFVFDKTGTLTKGTFTVTAVHPEELSEEDLLCIAATAEGFSDHPISRSLKAAHVHVCPRVEVTSPREISGKGVAAVMDGRTVYVGNQKLMEDAGVVWHDCDKAGTIVHVAVNEKYMGHIVISDELKPDAARLVKELERLGVLSTVLLTGDKRSVADEVGATLGIGRVVSELLPDGKVEQIERLILEKHGAIAFVGDGINDAPVLARADIGIAMGALGSEAAIEAADIVVMDDSPLKISLALQIAMRTNRIVKENIIFTLAAKAAVLALGALGFAPIWLAVFADVGVSLLAVINSLRMLRG